MSKSLCTFNHLLVEELQGTAALCLEIKKKKVWICQREAARTGAVWMLVKGTEQHPGQEGAISQKCFDGIMTRRGKQIPFLPGMAGDLVPWQDCSGGEV